MPTASHNEKKKRRIKRELSLAYRIIGILTQQRDEARMTAHGLEQELKKWLDPSSIVAPEMSGIDPEPVYGSVAATLAKEGGTGQ